jgi:lysophospholipase L1-like esterase
MTQLMESTAVAIPGLASASEALRHNTEQTAAALGLEPRDPILTYQLVNQVKAFRAVSDTFPRPNPMPSAAEEQFSEMREGVQRLQRHFEALLESAARERKAREADPNDLKRYADANARLLPAAKAPRVVFMGDSITDLWRLNEYFTGRDFVNRGIGGQTTTQMLGRFMQDVIALHPKAVVILAGTNDLARGIQTRGIEDNLAMMGDLAKANGIKPIFASILPVSDYHKDADPRYEMTKVRPPFSIQQVNLWLKEYCRREGFTYVDYYSAMADSHGLMPADEADDGLHPNAKGYRVMSPLALAAVDHVLAEQAPVQPAQKRRFSLVPGK